MEISSTSVSNFQPPPQTPARSQAPLEAQPDRGETTVASATAETRESATEERQERNAAPATDSAPPTPTYNLQGQRVGGIINVTA